MSKKVGLLLPRSVIFPSIAFDIMGGLRCSLDHAGAQCGEIVSESIGIAADDKQIYAACEKMLFSGVNIVVGYVNPSTAEKLEPLFAGANAVFIALDAGYHFPSSATAKFPHVFYLSLQGALCIRMAVTKALASGNRKFAYTSSFFDTGYRSAFAAHKGIIDNGGEVVFNLVTPLKRNEITLESLVAHCNETQVDAVFAAFCGDMLQDYFTAARSANVFDAVKVYGSPFVGEEQWLAQSPYPGTEISVCVPWASTLNSPANDTFLSLLKQKGIKANVFSVLGWEAGCAINAVYEEENPVLLLEGFSFDSPRGRVILNADSHQCLAPIYNATVKEDDATHNCILVIDGIATDTVQQRRLLEEDINGINGPMTSWLNAYACLDS